MKAFDASGGFLDVGYDREARASILAALKLAEDALGKYGTRNGKCQSGHLLLALLEACEEPADDRFSCSHFS